MREIKKVLFLCMANSARSQMAEGILRALGQGRWIVQSAGVFSSYVHPLAVQAMEEIGIDISRQTSKSVSRFVKKKFDYLITLCDDAAGLCPHLRGAGKRVHWSFEDPAAAVGTVEERLSEFRKTRDKLKIKIEEFLRCEPPEIPDPIASFQF